LDGTCPAGLACDARLGCAPARLDSLCVPKQTDCSAAGAGATCALGVCALPCRGGAGCPSGRVCSSAVGDGFCLLGCGGDGGACARTLACTDLWYAGKKGCLPSSQQFPACKS